jgi:glycosyltransferase involved in cell wall biosynthesis
VIIPAYNSAEVLPDALRSVEAQTSGDWEVVVCDDASSDDTADVAESFGERVRVVRNERNLGPAGARNNALAAARGEFIALLDADDYWLPEYIAEQLALYEANEAEQPGVGIVSCDSYLLGPHGPAEGTYRDRIPFPSRPTLSKLLAAPATIPASALMPRTIAEEVGGFSLECYGAEDYDLWVKVLERGYRAVSNPKALAVFRLHGDSVSSNDTRITRNLIAAYRLSLDRGHLRWRERWIARRQVRVCGLIVDIGEIQNERSASGRLPIRRVLSAILRGLVVGVQNPQRWPPVAQRLLRQKGSLGERLSPGRDSHLLDGPS